MWLWRRGWILDAFKIQPAELALGWSKDSLFTVAGEKVENVGTDICMRANGLIQLWEVLLTVSTSSEREETMMEEGVAV